ncbi:hypothetical protein [Emticicia sp. 17c]|uniref:hypothetical protein n=1 Tax=Emticicia sp. 17c TaxID=3127704 RepID=UPI00301B7948
MKDKIINWSFFVVMVVVFSNNFLFGTKYDVYRYIPANVMLVVTMVVGTVYFNNALLRLPYFKSIKRRLIMMGASCLFAIVVGLMVIRITG